MITWSNKWTLYEKSLKKKVSQEQAKSVGALVLGFPNALCTSLVLCQYFRMIWVWACILH